MEYYKQIIKEWRLNKEILSSKMNMPSGTFKHKLNETKGKYHFNDDEKNRLINILVELSSYILDCVKKN